jgi:hypothetical protein
MLGRWLSRDPLIDAENEEGPNIYLYTRNNSIMIIDDLGMMMIIFPPALKDPVWMVAPCTFTSSKVHDDQCPKVKICEYNCMQAGTETRNVDPSSDCPTDVTKGYWYHPK